MEPLETLEPTPAHNGHKQHGPWELNKPVRGQKRCPCGQIFSMRAQERDEEA